MISEDQKAWLEDKQYEFGIFIHQTDKLVGTVSFFFIERGTVEKCMIGYGLDHRYKGNGYMIEAVKKGKKNNLMTHLKGDASNCL